MTLLELSTGSATPSIFSPIPLLCCCGLINDQPQQAKRATASKVITFSEWLCTSAVRIHLLSSPPHVPPPPHSRGICSHHPWQLPVVHCLMLLAQRHRQKRHIFSTSRWLDRSCILFIAFVFLFSLKQRFSQDKRFSLIFSRYIKKCQDKRFDITVQLLYQSIIHIQSFCHYKHHCNGGVITLSKFKLQTKYLRLSSGWGIF